MGVDFILDNIRKCELNKKIQVEDIMLVIKDGEVPDFIKNPIFTGTGYPLASKRQEKCDNYCGQCELNKCLGCIHFKEVDDSVGLCTCSCRKIKDIE